MKKAVRKKNNKGMCDAEESSEKKQHNRGMLRRSRCALIFL